MRSAHLQSSWQEAHEEAADDDIVCIASVPTNGIIDVNILHIENQKDSCCAVPFGKQAGMQCLIKYFKTKLLQACSTLAKVMTACLCQFKSLLV